MNSPQKAKILLQYPPLKEYIQQLFTDDVYDYLINRLFDEYDFEVEEKIQELGEDPGDWDPSYETWDELIDAEKETIVERLTFSFITRAQLPDELVQLPETQTIINSMLKEFLDDDPYEQ